MDRSGKSRIPFVPLKMAGLKDKASKNNSKKQEDAGLIISDYNGFGGCIINRGNFDLSAP